MNVWVLMGGGGADRGDAVIKVKFLQRFLVPLRSGLKTCTARTERLGVAGEVFEAFGDQYMLTAVRRVTLKFVAECLWRYEGVGSPDEFRKVWKSLHPRAGFRPHRVVYIHHFERMRGGVG